MNAHACVHVRIYISEMKSEGTPMYVYRLGHSWVCNDLPNGAPLLFPFQFPCLSMSVFTMHLCLYVRGCTNDDAAHNGTAPFQTDAGLSVCI